MNKRLCNDFVHNDTTWCVNGYMETAMAAANTYKSSNFRLKFKGNRIHDKVMESDKSPLQVNPTERHGQ